MDTVMTYELDREQKTGIRLETVQQMLNAITSSANERSQARVFEKITGYKGPEYLKKLQDARGWISKKSFQLEFL